MRRNPGAPDLRLAFMLLVVLHCTPIQTLPPSVTVTGRVQGVDGVSQPLPDQTLTLAHTQAATEPHLQFTTVPRISHVQRIDLEMTDSTGLPFTEEWHLLHLSREAQRPGAEPVFVEFTGDPGWVRDNVGDLAWITVRKNDLALPQGNFSNFPPASLRRSGSTILARIEDDDVQLPWIRTQCGPLEAMPLAATLRPLAPAGGVDCFDMQSLTSSMLNNVALTVAAAARNNNARANAHRMAVVPHVPSTTTGDAAPLPGFGFVYEATLEPVVIGVGAAPFTGTLTVSVPISIHWRRVPPATLSILLDPLSQTFAGEVIANTNRVTVSATQGSLAELAAADLRTSVSDAIASAPMPTGPAGIPLTSFLELLFTESMIRPAGGLPVNFSLLAIPDDRTVAGAPRNIAITLGEVTVTDITPVAPQAGGNGARVITPGAGGAVTISQNLNAAGTRTRVFVIPPPVEPLPFRLVFLR